MSRSKKKHPGGWICNVRPGEMKAWKRKQNRKLRRDNDYIPDGTHYKKINETYTSPGDGKGWFDSQFWGKATDKTFRK